MTDRGQLAHQESSSPRSPTLGETVSPATLLVGSSSRSGDHTRDGAVALLHARTGTTIWRAALGREVGTLAQDGAQFYVAFGSRLRPVRPSRRESLEQRRQRYAYRPAEPAWLEARSAVNGRLLWRRADWDLLDRLDVGAEAGGGVVIVGSAYASRFGDRALYGLDARTGTTRWTYPATGRTQFNGYRFVLRAGRLYCYGEGTAGGFLVLDAATGGPLWSRGGWPELVFSPGGQIVVQQEWNQDRKCIARTLDPATGDVRQELVVDGQVRAVTDAGAACLATGSYEHPALAFARLEGQDWRELWRTDDIVTEQLAVTDSTIYCAHLLMPEGVGEVEALEVDSGRRRWRWRTPGDLRALLRLWGVRTPWIAASSAVLMGKALADAVTRPSPREIRIALWRELAAGRWRRPYALHSGINAMWLAADAGTAYLGTWLGVFALRADSGGLLWHALPTTDVSFLAPALSLT
jgi:outer membrane protein assembly factor BamB